MKALKARLDDEDAWGQKLSGGERQRLALARVFLKNPRWVLADEATAALDAEAEQVLYRRLVDRIDARGGGLVSRQGWDRDQSTREVDGGFAVHPTFAPSLNIPRAG
jgi:ABC-type Mn2+/Zn2+ transport system ATPase subunit